MEQNLNTDPNGSFYSGQDKRRYKRMLKRKLMKNVK